MKTRTDISYLAEWLTLNYDRSCDFCGAPCTSQVSGLTFLRNIEDYLSHRVEEQKAL